MLFATVTAILGLAALSLLRLVWVALKHPHLPKTVRPLSVCVVLGSGGHTSEMFRAIDQLPKGAWTAHRPFYIVSATDKDSANVAEKFETTHRRSARVLHIPRAREVGQSYVTSIATTLKALATCLRVVAVERPDVILTNGPGVCIPVVAASFVLASVGLMRRPAVTYFESFTCVSHLSMSGKLLLRIADVFTVQWPQTMKVAAAAPRLMYTGPFAESGNVENDDEDLEPLKTPTSTDALVTVGSTKFDELIEAIDSGAFLKALKAIGINRLLVQKGRSTYALSAEAPAGLEVDVFDYRPGLAETIRGAALVISHAGAGTILEALNAGVRTVVVPNPRLMSNHQLQLAKALQERRHLFMVQVDSLGVIPRLEFESLRQFPADNAELVTAAFAKVLPLPTQSPTRKAPLF